MFEESLEELLNQYNLLYDKEYDDELKGYMYKFNIGGFEWSFVVSNKKRYFLGGNKQRNMILCNEVPLIDRAIEYIRNEIEKDLEIENTRRIIQ